MRDEIPDRLFPFLLVAMCLGGSLLKNPARMGNINSRVHTKFHQDIKWTHTAHHDFPTSR
jgi:hypothetical protein